MIIGLITPSAIHVANVANVERQTKFIVALRVQRACDIGFGMAPVPSGIVLVAAIAIPY